jgi:hypothetical protein
MNTAFKLLLSALLLLALPAAVQAQWVYTSDGSTITITGYTYKGYLGALTIPDTINELPVTTIASQAFYRCNLGTVTIGTNVTSIATLAFGNVFNLGAIVVDPENSLYSSANGVLFDKGGATLIAAPGGLAGHYTIPSSVTSIGTEAFYACMDLTSVTIPDSVTNIGGSAFYYCTGLASVTIPNSVTSTGDGVFQGCSGLSSVTIPNSVTSIGLNAFANCTSLASVTIPSSVTSIVSGAFQSCSSLSRVCFLGNGITADPSVFYNAHPIVYYLPGTTGWDTSFAGRPTALWFLPKPLILNNLSSFGVQTNRFGFIISWATNIPVVVEACTGSAISTWSALSTNTLTNGACYFSDADWANHPARFYRIRSP